MTHSPSDGNGERGVEHQPVDTIILTYNRATDKLEIGGHTNSFDLMLDMLGRATRATEFMVRKQQALEISAAARRAAEDERIAAELRGKR